MEGPNAGVVVGPVRLLLSSEPKEATLRTVVRSLLQLVVTLGDDGGGDWVLLLVVDARTGESFAARRFPSGWAARRARERLVALVARTPDVRRSPADWAAALDRI